MRIIDNLKEEIKLQKTVTNKFIKADRMSKKPRVILIRDSYPDLYKKEEKEQRKIFKG